MNQADSPRKNEKGFTLIEAFMAVVILTVSLLSLAQLMVVSLEHFEFAKYDTKAVRVAQSKMEELKALYGWQIDSGNLSPKLETGSHGPELVVPAAPGGSTGEPTNFWVTWQVDDLGKGQKGIAVTVRPPVLNPRLNELVTINSVFAP